MAALAQAFSTGAQAWKRGGRLPPFDYLILIIRCGLTADEIKIMEPCPAFFYKVLFKYKFWGGYDEF
jgi:hypothetical protein